MPTERKYVMSIAGFDPSGGAGLLADIKTFEQHKVHGLSVNTGNTLQTATTFYSVQWAELKDVLKAIEALLNEYPVKAIKTGIVPSFDFLWEIVSHVKKINKEIKIIVDPVIRSTTGFDFQKGDQRKKLTDVLSTVFLITPNSEESMILANNKDAKSAAVELSKYCNVLLKGGHSNKEKGIDHLYTESVCFDIRPTIMEASAKHGSGCVLSAAITSNLALGYDLKTACTLAKKYVEQFLSSNKTLLGYHTA